MQYAIKAANFPLTPDDFERGTLPSTIAPHRAKLFGLSIQPERLAEVRNERRPNSRYAQLEQCRYEVAEAERMMRREGISAVDHHQVHRGNLDHGAAGSGPGPDLNATPATTPPDARRRRAGRLDQTAARPATPANRALQALRERQHLRLGQRQEHAGRRQ